MNYGTPTECRVGRILSLLAFLAFLIAFIIAVHIWRDVLPYL